MGDSKSEASAALLAAIYTPKIDGVRVCVTHPGTPVRARVPPGPLLNPKSCFREVQEDNYLKQLFMPSPELDGRPHQTVKR